MKGAKRSAPSNVHQLFVLIRKQIRRRQLRKEPRANVDGLCTLAQETEAAPPEKYCQPLLYGDAIGERTPAVSSDNDVLRAGEGRRNQFQVTALKEYKHS